MNSNNLIKALWQMKLSVCSPTPKMACFGCGHEHDCGISGCKIIKNAITTLEQLQAENAKLREQMRWRDATKELPPPETEVLVICNKNGYKFVCPAIYEDGSMTVEDSIWTWYDYHEHMTYDAESDQYIIPEGWWENRHFTPDDVYNNPIDVPVTHWMPMPEPQEEQPEEVQP